MPRTTLSSCSRLSLQITLIVILGAASAIGSYAQTFNSLASFNRTNGANPYYTYLAQGLDGNLYATASAGGANNDGDVFRITTAGTLTDIYAFCSLSACADGTAPSGGLLLTPSGYFYGTTFSGGASNAGSVFKLSPSHVLTTLHSFDSTDGANIYFGLMQATNGNFYGYGTGGGSGSSGTIFEITPAGVFTLLHSFDASDGRYPNGVLVEGTNGILYGSTYQGGGHGLGTVFEITLAGKFTSLYDFTGGADGGSPADAFIQASNGLFYGTTSTGGANGQGTVFSMTPAGKITTLYSFCAMSGCTDSGYSYGRLVQATDGNLYGTTLVGGAHNAGSIFRITPAGKFTSLYSFCAKVSKQVCTDGQSPYEGLTQATNGVLYGTTYAGGTTNQGTVFSLSAGLKPFVHAVISSGKVGASVTLLGTNLAGATAVSFNGTASAITKATNTWLTTTVPAGASTGTIAVTTPGGVLSSNIAYRVTPQITGFSPVSGSVGTLVKIAGVSLSKASRVTFGGVAATFTVVSDTEVDATVPTGAITGKVNATTTGGTAVSPTSFTVN